MRNKLIETIRYRQENEIPANSILKAIREVDAELLVDASIPILYLYTRTGKGIDNVVSFVDVIVAIGNNVIDECEFKKNTNLAARIGAFVLYSYEIFSIIKVELSSTGKNSSMYTVNIIDDDAIVKLWTKSKVTAATKLPSLTPYDDWTSGIHSTKVRMVKTNSDAVISKLSPEKNPIIFSVINRIQSIGWRVNEDVYNIYIWCLRNKAQAFSSIWELQNPTARASKLREAKTIGEIANRFIDKVFYHLCYMDFRGRIYNYTAYFHSQGSDMSRGMLYRADKKPITEQGFFWLMISIATNWAGDAGRDDKAKTDKIPLNDRVYWALDNEELFISYAENPKVNQGWMNADAPFQFIAACMELKKFRDWQKLNPGDPYGYESHLEVFIDGSTNGSQHLCALTRDEVSAPYVNLVESDLPGDLYAYVAKSVWNNLSEKVKHIANFTQLEEVIDTLTDLKLQINQAPLKSDRRKELIEEIRAFRTANEALIKEAAPVFWSRITDLKQRRKIVKRNTMTISLNIAKLKLGEFRGTPFAMANPEPSLVRKDFEGATTKVYSLEQTMKPVEFKRIRSAQRTRLICSMI